jgi:hypothetical protein
MIRMAWVELEIVGFLPKRIGRHRIADTLLQWEEGHGR